MQNFDQTESFVPAKDVAREFGYTSDYVGKLAREGKIIGSKQDCTF